MGFVENSGIVATSPIIVYFKGDKVNVSKKEIEKTLEKLSQELL